MQVSVGPRVARALRQSAPSSVTGFVRAAILTRPPTTGAIPRPRGVLAQAGFDPRRVLRLGYPLDGASPIIAQVLQANLARAGIDVGLLPVAVGDYYDRLLSDNANARRGAWDLAIVGWFPDWFGGQRPRSSIVALRRAQCADRFTELGLASRMPAWTPQSIARRTRRPTSLRAETGQNFAFADGRSRGEFR